MRDRFNEFGLETEIESLPAQVESPEKLGLEVGAPTAFTISGGRVSSHKHKVFEFSLREEGTAVDGDTMQRALLAWCTVHGVAKLANAGRLPFRTKAEIFRFAEYVIDQSLPPRGAE